MRSRFTDDRGPAGFSWLVEEPMTRTSHALAADGRFWLVDPTAWTDALERARGLGEAAGVLQLLDRHGRDCAAVAAALGVPHLRVPEAVPDSPFVVIPLLDRKRWREVALWWEHERTLVVAEVLGSNPFFVVGDDVLGVHGLLKPFPPRRQLGAFAPRHVLVGHGSGVHGADATPALRQALERSPLSVLGWLARLPRANARAAAYLRELDANADR